MAYKLTTYGNVINLDNGVQFPASDGNRHYEEYKVFIAGGGVPEPADVPTTAQVAKALERSEAESIAKAFYVGHPAVTAFIRDNTPAQREAQIQAMTLAQLRTVVIYLVEAVVAIIKREYLD